MKISRTNERELKSAINNILKTRDTLSKVIYKIERRNMDTGHLHEIYTTIWNAHSDLNIALEKSKITVGGV